MNVHKKFIAFIVCLAVLSSLPAFADHYATTDMTWAEFYAGEVGEASSDLLADGLDAVSTATTRFVTRFNQTISSSDESGSLYSGIKAVQVRMSDDVYLLLSNDSRYTWSSTEFDEYKIVSSDGSFGKTITETLAVSGASVTLSSGASSNHGDYILNVNGLDFDALGLKTGDSSTSFDYYLGAAIETTDGKIYGLRPLYNIWVRTNQLGFSVKDFTERNGTILDAAYTQSLAGATISKITYILKDQPDPYITCNIYVRDSTTATAAPDYESGFKAFEIENGQVTARIIVSNSPSGANYNKIASISYDDPNGHHGWSTLNANYYTYSNGVLIMSGDIVSATHTYNVILEDSNGKFADISTRFNTFATDATSLIISDDNNAGAVNFLLTPSGVCDSVDNFMKESNFVIASDYTSPDKNFSVVYEGGENQVKGSGFSFDITLNNVPSGKIGVVGFGKIFYLTPDNCGSMYNHIYSSINALETYPSGFKGVFGKMFREMGLKVWSVLDDGSLRDVTDYVGAGAMISDDNNIMIYYGVMLADREITSNDEGNTYYFSPEGETLLSDGTADNHLIAAYYFEVLDEDAGVIDEADNKAGISFEVMKPGFIASADNAANEKKLTWIIGDMALSASSQLITGKTNQIAGDSGFSFSVEVDSSTISSDYTPIIGFSKIFEFTASNLGTDDFNALKTRVTELVNNSGNFYTSDYTALTESGISVMASYPDLGIQDIDITNTMQFGLFVSGDAVLMSYGAVAVDRALTGNEGELLNIGFEQCPLMSDGIEDEIITASWYITHAGTENLPSSSSGCNAFSSSIILLFGLALIKCNKSR
ncbi:MAG: hypothetical protein IJT21_01020 [Synergistaceae bacterium]|nr:hypothetical protein [Synergistaceae bacterium]